MSKLINLWTWAVAALVVVGFPVCLLVDPSADPDSHLSVRDAAFIGVLMLVFHVGFIVSPIAVGIRWYFRVLIAGLMLPCCAVLVVLVIEDANSLVSGPGGRDTAPWLIPLTLLLLTHLAVLFRLLVGTWGDANLIQPAARQPTTLLADRPPGPSAPAECW